MTQLHELVRDATPSTADRPPTRGKAEGRGPGGWGVGRLLNRDPILLCGAPRTGTSWTAKVMSLGGNSRYLREPMTQSGAAGLNGRGGLRYLTAGDDDPGYEAAWRFALSVGGMFSKRWLMAESGALSRRLPFWPARLIVKEVNCPLALEWLSARFGMKVVITIRHPCGYVASGLRLKELGHPVLKMGPMLGQPRLMGRYFADDQDWLSELEDPVARMAAAYGMVYKVIGDQLTRHPEWVLISHESACEDPTTQFRRLFQATRLRFGRRVKEFLAATTEEGDGQPYSLRRRSSDEPDKWKAELTTAQIETVRSVVSRFRLPFYREFA